MWGRREHMGCHDPTQAEPLPAMWVAHLLHQFSKSSCLPAKKSSLLVWGRVFITFRCFTVLTNPLWKWLVQLVNIIPHNMLIFSDALCYLIPEAQDSYKKRFYEDYWAERTLRAKWLPRLTLHYNQRQLLAAPGPGFSVLSPLPQQLV